MSTQRHIIALETLAAGLPPKDKAALTQVKAYVVKLHNALVIAHDKNTEAKEALSGLRQRISYDSRENMVEFDGSEIDGKDLNEHLMMADTVLGVAQVVVANKDGSPL